MALSVWIYKKYHSYDLIEEESVAVIDSVERAEDAVAALSPPDEGLPASPSPISIPDNEMVDIDFDVIPEATLHI